MEKKNVRMAIAGTGMIVHDALKALEQVPEIDKRAIFARPHSRQKADDLAAQYGIPAVYTDFDQMLREADVDVVYIGLVNSAHCTYARQALLAGKHVIMEKPFTSTAQEAEEVAALAQEKGLFVLEAVTCLRSRIFDKMQEILPQLGTIRLVQANYSQYSSRYDRYLQGQVEPCFDPVLSGGALYDINIYNLNLIVGLFGQPDAVQYYANKGFNGIDTSGTAVLSYPGFQAVSTGAKDSGSPSFFLVQGEKGWMRIPESPNAVSMLEYEIRGEEKQLYAPEKYPHRMIEEFHRMAHIISSEDEEAAQRALETSSAVLKTAERARHSAGIVFGCDKTAVNN